MNPTLDKMVYALVNLDNEKATEHLRTYFTDTTARLINAPDPVEPSESEDTPDA